MEILLSSCVHIENNNTKLGTKPIVYLKYDRRNGMRIWSHDMRLSVTDVSFVLGGLNHCIIRGYMGFELNTEHLIHLSNF